MLVVAVLIAGCAWSSAPAPAPAAEKWSLWQNEHGCVISHDDRGRRVALTLLRFPDTGDAGIMEMTLDDPALLPAAAVKSSVRLEFDAGPVEGYLIREVSPGVPGVMMTTYALKQVTSAMKGATTVKVTSGQSSATFNLPGFADSLPQLLDCAESKI